VPCLGVSGCASRRGGGRGCSGRGRTCVTGPVAAGILPRRSAVAGPETYRARQALQTATYSGPAASRPARRRYPSYPAANPYHKCTENQAPTNVASFANLPPRAVHAQRHRRSGTHRTKRGPAGRATTRRPRCRIRRQPRPRPLRCRNRSLCQALRRLGWARHPSLCDAHRRRVVFLTRRGACGHAPLLVEYAVSVQGVPYLTGRGGQAAGGTTEPPRIHPPDR
jgi:hypothetical protein